MQYPYFDNFGNLLGHHQAPMQYPTQYPQAANPYMGGQMQTPDINFVLAQVQEVRDQLTGVASIVRNHEAILQSGGFNPGNEDYNPNAMNAGKNPFNPNAPISAPVYEQPLQQPISDYGSTQQYETSEPIQNQSDNDQYDQEEIMPVFKLNPLKNHPFSNKLPTEDGKLHTLPSSPKVFATSGTTYVDNINLRIKPEEGVEAEIIVIDEIVLDDRVSIDKNILKYLLELDVRNPAKSILEFFEKNDKYNDSLFAYYIDTLLTNRVNEFLDSVGTGLEIEHFSNDYEEVMASLKEDYDMESYVAMEVAIKNILKRDFFDVYAEILDKEVDDEENPNVRFLSERVLNIYVDRVSLFLGFSNSDLTYEMHEVDLEDADNALLATVAKIMENKNVARSVITTMDKQAYTVLRDPQGEITIKKYESSYC